MGLEDNLGGGEGFLTVIHDTRFGHLSVEVEGGDRGHTAEPGADVFNR